MPGQTARSSIFGKFAPRINKGITDHREDELDLGGFGPPPGINGGTAQVTGCKFGTIAQGKQNAGAPYFMLEAVIIDPVEHTFADPPGSRPKTVTTEGVQIRQMINITDSPKATKYRTVEDKVGQVLNELRKLGVDTTSLGNDHELLAAATMITESRPLVRFRTWKGKATEDYPDPRVNVSFEGLAEEMPAGGEDAGDGMDDATGGPPDTDDSGDDDGSGGDDETEKAKQGANGQATPGKKGTPAVKGKTGARSTAAAANPAKEFDETASPPDSPSDEAEEEPGDDLDALAREATAGSDDAQQRLSELAVNAGISEQDMRGMTSWEEVAVAIGDVGNGGDDQEKEPEPLPVKPTTMKSGKVSVPSSAATAPAAATSTPVKSGTASSPVPKDEQVYMYKPMVRNPRTKKDEPSAKAVECLVIRVHPTTKTVDLKNLEDSKNTYKGVSWDALESR
jgi:hypothetical protein